MKFDREIVLQIRVPFFIHEGLIYSLLILFNFLNLGDNNLIQKLIQVQNSHDSYFHSYQTNNNSLMIKYFFRTNQFKCIFFLAWLSIRLSVIGYRMLMIGLSLQWLCSIANKWSFAITFIIHVNFIPFYSIFKWGSFLDVYALD